MRPSQCSHAQQALLRPDTSFPDLEITTYYYYYIILILIIGYEGLVEVTGRRFGSHNAGHPEHRSGYVWH